MNGIEEIRVACIRTTILVSFAILWIPSAAALGQMVSAPTTSAAVEPFVMLRAGFEDGLSDWEQSGSAEFAVDPNEHHSGGRSARITVGPDANAQGMLSYSLPGVAPGDWISISAWVRTRDVTGGAGAFDMLEFFDANGVRKDFVHPSYRAERGRAGWERATIEWIVPSGTASVRFSVALRSRGTAWFDDVEVLRTYRHADLPSLGDARRQVVVHADQVVNETFGGVGFHVFDHAYSATREQLDEVVNKRWRELAPSFARVNLPADWERAKLDEMADRLQRLRETGTEVYVTTWDPPEANTPQELAAYARKAVDNLTYLVRDKGLTNIRYYCMSNELTLGKWGSLHADLPRFKAYHQALFNELKARKLEIGLLATDASPLSYWDSIEWAAQNMDEITAVYGGHHYFEEFSPDDVQFYPWFQAQMEWGARLARKKGKDFILGEFGGKVETSEKPVGGKTIGKYAYYETPQEPVAAVQLCEAAMAAINGGVHAMGFWTFADFALGKDSSLVSRTGLFWWEEGNYAARPAYYGYGLLSKFLRGPATVYKVNGNDPLLRVAAVQHHGSRTWSIAALNRNGKPVNMDLAIEGTLPTASFRKYVFDPNNVPQNSFGDLPGPAGKVAMKGGRLSDTVGPLTLVIYTTAYDDEPPAPVTGLRVEPAGDGRNRLSWQSNAEKDFCYYRVFRSERPDFTPDLPSQIASTIATHFTDAKAAAGKEYHYKVLAVDSSGNASR
jgi:hypothetical protein